jgi:hypothetical protein
MPASLSSQSTARAAGAPGETGDDLGEPGAHGGAPLSVGVRAGPGRDESGDAGDVVGRGEGVVADHHVKSGQGVAVLVVDGDPGRVADDVEAGVRCAPLLAEAAAQQAVHLDAPVEFLAEVLPPGVGDAQAQRQLEHRGGARAVDGADGGGGVPGRAVGAEVPEESGAQQGGRLGAVPDLARLPGVQRQCGEAPGQREVRAGEPFGEPVGGQGPAAFRPCRVGRAHRGRDREPVQREGAAQLG